MRYLLYDNRGSALLITLAILAMMSIVALTAANRSQDDIEMSFNQLHEEQAFYVAEAGATQAIAMLNQTDTWRAGYDSASFGPGFYTVTLADSLVDSTLFDTVIITSLGEVDFARSGVVLTSAPVYHRPFAFGMFSGSSMNLSQQTCTDSYNSDSGSYAATVLDSLGSVGSNGTLTSDQLVTFGGDVSVATEGGLSLGNNNTINGDTTSTADSVDLGFIPQANYDSALANNSAPAGLSGAGYVYDGGTYSLIAGSGGNIVLAGGTYYFSRIELGKNSTLSIAPGASVEIYMEGTGNILLGQGSTVNLGGIPSDFIVYSQGDSLHFDQDNTFVGAYFGPNAYISYDQSSQIYGSIVGDSVQVDKFACFHYDRSLYDITKGTTGEFQLVAWYSQ